MTVLWGWKTVKWSPTLLHLYGLWRPMHGFYPLPEKIISSFFVLIALVFFSCVNEVFVIVPPTTTHTITTVAGDGGSITPKQTVSENTSVRITAKPEEHHQLKQWTGDCGNFDRESLTIQFTATKDCTIQAVVEAKNPLYLDENGITVKSHPWGRDHLGESFPIDYEDPRGVVLYRIVDESMLRDLVEQEAYADLEKINTTFVDNMEDLFEGLFDFNANIASWDVRGVTNMRGMFRSASRFNQDIGAWDVSKVTDMYAMFTGNFFFNQDIGDWDVSNVTDMEFMFAEAFEFDQDIGDWDVSNVTNIRFMFLDALAFNGDIGDWDVGKVTTMIQMFLNAKSFNQDIGDWDVSNVMDMSYMFRSAESFNQDIGDWDVSNVTTMHSMFLDALAFNQDVSGWDVSRVTDCTRFATNAPIDGNKLPTFSNCTP